VARERRMVARSSYVSKKLLKCTDSQFLLFIGLIVEADDEGRGEGEPDALKLKFPNRHWSEKKIEAMMGHLSQLELVEWYTNNGGQYYEVVNFLDFQQGSWHGRSAKKSRIPSPYVSTSVVHHKRCTDQPEVVTPSTGSAPKRSKEKRSKEKIREGGGNPPPPEIEELCSLVINIPGWTRDDDADIKLFSGLLDLGISVPLVKKTIEDLRVYQEKPKKAYKNLRQALRNWCKREFERRANEPTCRRVGYGKS